MKKLLFLCMAIAATGFFSSGTAQASTCPAIGWANDCNVIITLNPGPVANIVITSEAPYDGVEDQLVGVNNLSGGPVSSLTLSAIPIPGVDGIFHFDGDGAGMPGTGCIINPSPPNPCFPGGAFGNTGYEGPGTSFAVVDDNNGTVLFTGGLAYLGTAWFSLEGQPLSGAFTVTSVNVPEPGSLLLLGAGLAGLVLWGRKQAA